MKETIKCSRSHDPGCGRTPVFNGAAELEVSGDCGWLCPPLRSTLWGRTAERLWGRDHGTTHTCRPVQCVPVPAAYSCPVSPRGAGALMGEGSAAGGWRLRGSCPSPAACSPGTPGGTCCAQPLRSGLVTVALCLF